MKPKIICRRLLSRQDCEWFIEDRWHMLILYALHDWAVGLWADWGWRGWRWFLARIDFDDWLHGAPS